ncbi:MAG: hypothetical protein RMJ00_04600 [Nitrososphaerota archaeon]|nr:hypothetical protein [Candidatus Bathyarchaeota archaeon]MDW8061959.1 hypothetical protein [Nitrososphaerota archaeon]
MSEPVDTELESIKKRMLAKLQKKIVSDRGEQSEQKLDPERYVESNLEGKAVEVFECFKQQYPGRVYRIVVEALAKAMKNGAIPTPLDATTLYSILLNIGLRVRLPSRIYVAKKGEVKDFSEYLREKLSEE